MNLNEFLNLLATIFGTLGSIYVMIGILSISPEIMEKQSSMYWDFSVPQIENLAKQKADSISGFIFIIGAFALTFINILFVPNSIEVFKTKILAIAFVAILAGATYAALYFVSSGIYKNQKFEIGKIITLRNYDEIIERGYIKQSEADSICTYANLLNIKIDNTADLKITFMNVANEIGIEVPRAFDFSKLNTVK